MFPQDEVGPAAIMITTSITAVCYMTAILMLIFVAASLYGYAYSNASISTRKIATKALQYSMIAILLGVTSTCALMPTLTLPPASWIDQINKNLATPLPGFGFAAVVLACGVVLAIIISAKSWKSFTGEYVLQKERMKKHLALMADTESDDDSSTSSAKSSSFGSKSS